MTQVTYHNGGIIQNVHVVLIFWGSYWEGDNPNPSVQAISDAVSGIVTGTYMSRLAQYSASSGSFQTIGPGVLYGTQLITSSFASSPGDPPNPFTDTHITVLISDCIRTGIVPPPDDKIAGDNQLLYCVVLPPNWTFKDNPIYVGQHDHYTLWNFLWNHVVHYAWVTQNGGSLDILSCNFSHELVEACTDPDNGSGWYQDSDGNEIGDLCESIMGRLDNNIFVQAYWSNADNQCVIPIQKFVKDTKDTKETKEYKDGKDHKGEHGKEIKDAKEKDRDSISGRSWINVEFPRSSDETGRTEANGQAFIRSEERPAVGEQTLTQTQDVE